MAVEVLVLGAPAVVVDGARQAIRGDQAGAVLALLALHPGRAVSVDALVEAAWGDDAPAGVGNALQAIVSRLRRIVGRDSITSTGATYRLEVPVRAVDAERFASAIDDAGITLRSGDAAAARRLLDGALAEWRGGLLAGAEVRGRLIAERVRLEELRATALEDRIDALLSLGEHHVHEIEASIRDDPLRERRWAQLMLALYRSGRQADALRAYQRLRAVLVDELGIEPSPTVSELEARILAQDPTLDRPQTRGSPPLPGPMPSTGATAHDELLGRDDLRKTVLAALRDGDQVVITGPAGIGKSALARAAAAAFAAGDAPGGAHVVDLVGATGSDEVLARIGAAVGSPGRDGPTVLRSLRARRTVIVLDGCEAAPEAAVATLGLLRRDGRADVIATSRRSLDADARTVEVGGLAPADAVALFRHHAPSASATVPEEDVLSLVTALDTLPLAIELAAARSRYVTVGQMLERRSHLLDVAAGGATSLRAAMDDSVRLLEDPTRRVYAALSVLPGAFPLELAEAASAPVVRDSVVPALIELVEHHLLHLVDDGSDGGTPRYRMLDTIRAHALRRLERDGEANEVRRSVARWVEGLVRTAPAPDAIEEAAWLRALDEAAPVVLEAIAWLAGHEPARAAATVAFTAQWLDQRGRVALAERWLTALAADAAELDVASSCRFHGALARAAERLGDLPRARRHGDEAIQLAAEAADPVLEARWLAVQAFVAIRAGDEGRAVEMISRAVTLARDAGDEDAVVAVENSAAFLAYASGDVREAATRWEAAVAAARRLGSPTRLSSLLGNLAVVLDECGDLERGLVAADEAVALARVVDDPALLGSALVNRVTVLRHLGRIDAARSDVATALGLVDDLTDEAMTGELLSHATELALELDDRIAAQRAALHHTELSRRNGWDVERAHGLRDQGRVALAYGDPATAVTLFRASAELLAERGSPSHQGVVELLRTALAADEAVVPG